MYGVLDIGTTNIKFKVYDEKFKVVHEERMVVRVLETYTRSLARDPEFVKEALMHFSRKAGELGVKSLGISTYRSSVLAWDREGRPLSDIITWLDTRPRKSISSFFYRALSILPVFNKVLRADSPVVKMKWLLDSVEGLRSRVERGEAYIGTLSSYIAYLISGRYMDDVTNWALTGLIHPSNLKKLTPVYELLRIPESVSPELVDNNAYIGGINDVDVVALVADQQAAAIGSSCLEPGCVKLTTGTGVFADIPTNSFIMPGRGLIPIIIYSIDGRRGYGIEGFNPSGGVILDWLLGVELLKNMEEIDELLRRAKTSAVFQPSLAGMSFPEKRGYGTGLLYGLAPEMSRADLVRGVLEGLALATCSIMEELKRIAGKIDFIRADGGVSRSTSYLKLVASSCNLVVERVRGFDATSRGVAMLVALHMGKLNFHDLSNLVDVDLIVKPDELDIKVDIGSWRDSVKWGSKSS